MKIHVVSTGGTIVSEGGRNGLSPSRFSSRRVVDLMSSVFPEHTFSHSAPMNLDSSNIEPEDWSEIASEVFSPLRDCDGVIVTHGTDTMAYTASALAFMLRGIDKPVTLTGSQIPFGLAGSDAVSNLTLAVAALADGIKGVTVSFGGRVINGARAVKTSSFGMDAFESVGAPPRALFTASGLDILTENPARGGGPVLENDICPNVFLLKLAPGTNPNIFDALAGLGYSGVVMEAFGAGGVHSVRRGLASAARAAAARGMVIVVRSQCLYGRTDLNLYETGAAIRDCTISAGDMTTEAAVVKLMWALAKTSSFEEAAEIFRTNYAGEITLQPASLKNPTERNRSNPIRPLKSSEKMLK
ncbi:MAG: asparaginase [Synergistaceae bacterium]|jgi:L-asparaginase|nr:asparaginase [Synergistaceae bacterium]